MGAEDTAALLGVLRNYRVRFISELPYTLEMHFKRILRENARNDEKEGENNVQ